MASSFWPAQMSPISPFWLSYQATLFVATAVSVTASIISWDTTTV